MKHLLIYSDCAGMHGAEQVNHSLAMGLRAAGYRVSFAQPRAAHALIDEREALGIAHHWLPPEQLYDLGSEAPSLCDAGPARAILSRRSPRSGAVRRWMSGVQPGSQGVLSAPGHTRS